LQETEKLEPKTDIGKTLKRDLLQQIQEKFGNIEDVKLYAMAMLCDPRFKSLGFYKDDRTPLRVSRAISHLSKSL